MQRPVFGWGGWGRSRIIDMNGKDIAVTDAYWVIVLGTTGIFGLVFFCLIILVPTMRLLVKFPKDGWRNPRALLAIPVLIQLPLYAADCLLNDMGNPIYMFIAGGAITMTQMSGKMKLPETGDSEIYSNNSSRESQGGIYSGTQYI